MLRRPRAGQSILRPVPYRIDLTRATDDIVDRLIDLGALDVEHTPDGRLAAILPDRVPPDTVSHALGRARVRVSPAMGRDDGSVWVLHPRTVRIGRLRIVPANAAASVASGDVTAGDLAIHDSQAFGTGLHATTALCLEAIDEAVDTDRPLRMLDAGTGSGVLALAALRLGVPHAVGLDTDETALAAAAANARLNGLEARLTLVHGGPERLDGAWPLVVANILAAPLMAMAPHLIRRVERHGRLVLSGIASTLVPDVERTYRGLGMRHETSRVRDGWAMLIMRGSW